MRAVGGAALASTVVASFSAFALRNSFTYDDDVVVGGPYWALLKEIGGPISTDSY